MTANRSVISPLRVDTVKVSGAGGLICKTVSRQGRIRRAWHSSDHAALQNLRYTAVPWGKKLVIIIGQPKALGMAVKSRNSTRRLTKPAARIES